MNPKTFITLNHPIRNILKKFSFFFFLSGLFLIVPGCLKTDSTDTSTNAKDPYGIFTYSVKSNGIVSFTNTSENATSYLWDFGDLTTSNTSDVSFEHQYLQNGFYNVTLTAYGNGKSAKFYANLNITTVVSGTVSDIDGNVYHTVTIGMQVWMVENLKTTKYRNGNPIPNITDPTEWYNLTTGAYCDYDNTPGNSLTYGRLYNWYALNTGNLCPTGWHVPSDAEWTTLETYLGDASIAGGKLKETGTTHWQSPNTAATNETGFTGLPGGFRSSTGSYYSITYTGYWWSSTTGTDISYAWYRFLDFNIGFVNRNEDYKVDGLSVRCLKD